MTRRGGLKLAVPADLEQQQRPQLAPNESVMARADAMKGR
jgi:hypothetical protein